VKNILTIAALAFADLTLACDTKQPPGALAPRSGETDPHPDTDTSDGEVCPPPGPVIPPIATPEETSPCACSSDADCGLGLRCMPLAGPNATTLIDLDNNGEPDVWRCLAPMSGPSPLDQGKGTGGYHTHCTYGTAERRPFYPYGPGKSQPFCSACSTCAEPPAGALGCSGKI
jgi:hypothetical protein